MTHRNHRSLLSALFALIIGTLVGGSAVGQLRSGALNQPAPSAGPTGTGLVIAIPARSLVYSNTTRMLYASVPSSGPGETANSITVIDPLAGKVGRSVPLSTEPGDIVLSSQDRFIYVAVSDGTSIRRVNLATLTAGPAFPVGGGLATMRMVAVPGAPEAIAIARRRPGISPDNSGMAVYLNGLPTGDSTDPGHQLAQGIAPGRWFGYENMISSWSFSTLNISRDGVTSGGATGSLLSGNQSLQTSANGLLITGGGVVIDPETRQVLGDLRGLTDSVRGITGESHLLALGNTGMVYSISGRDGNYLLRAANLQTRTVQGEIHIVASGAKGTARDLVYAGDNRLAFTTGSSVVIVPTNLGTRLHDIDLSVKRSKLPTAVTRGSEITYTLTVKNNSTYPSTHVYLSDQLQSGVEPVTASASQGDAIVAERILRADLGGLGPGATAVVTVKVRIVETDKIGFAAVVRGAEPDPAGDNNIDIFDLSSSILLPDLTAAWSSAQQEAIGAGVNLRVTLHGIARVTNIGKKASVPTTVRFWAGQGPNFVPSLYLLLQEVPVPALAPGQSYDAELKAELGPGDDATGVYIFAQVDAKNLVEEKRKDNNVARTQMK